MGKTINLTLEDNKDILINVNGVLKHKISQEDRSITAQEIYEIMNYQKDDVFTIIEFKKNKKYDKENNVLKYFHKMFEDIINSLQTTPSIEEPKDEE